MLKQKEQEKEKKKKTQQIVTNKIIVAIILFNNNNQVTQQNYKNQTLFCLFLLCFSCVFFCFFLCIIINNNQFGFCYLSTDSPFSIKNCKQKLKRKKNKQNDTTKQNIRKYSKQNTLIVL